MYIISIEKKQKNNVIDFPTNKNNDTSFKFIQKVTGQTGNNDTKNVETMVPLNI